MDAISPPKPLADAYHLCKKHGLYFVTVQDRRDPAQPGEYVNAYVVYRQVPGQSQGIRLGRRRSPSALLAFVKKLTATETAPA